MTLSSRAAKAAELQTIFSEIDSQLSALRLTEKSPSARKMG
jgi:hypothetical protein